MRRSRTAWAAVALGLALQGAGPGRGVGHASEKKARDFEQVCFR